MADVIIYSTSACPYCVRAKMLLDAKSVSYKEIRVDSDAEKRSEMEHLSGRRTVPQIFINNKHVGGYDDLYALEKNGELDSWLNS